MDEYRVRTRQNRRHLTMSRLCDLDLKKSFVAHSMHLEPYLRMFCSIR